MADVSSEFERRLREAIQAGRILLGSVPTVIARIGNAAREQDIGARELADQVAADPVLAARLIRVANSSMYAGSHQVTKLHLAIARLGLPTSRRLILALSLSQSVKPSHPELRSRLAQQWTRSIEVAALSRVLAEHYSTVDPEEAFLAGLVHRIGVLPIVNVADQMRTPIRLDILEKSIESWQAKVGAWLLRNWHFPPSIVDVPVNVRDLQRDHPGSADVSDVVTIAALQTDGRLRDEQMAKVPAWHRLGLDATGGLILGADVEDQIQEARSLFE